MVVTPTICNLGVARVLIDAGTGLNLLSPDVFHKMQVEHELCPSVPFYGATNSKTPPHGRIELPVISGEQENIYTENITFDVAQFDLPYNTILGGLTLTKFMMAMHYAYGTAKVPGPSGAMHCSQRMYEAMATEPSEDAGRPKYCKRPPANEHISLDNTALTKTAQLGDDPSKVVSIGAQLDDK